jgi:YidC/Oxa1 family membrane protein insertase
MIVGFRWLGLLFIALLAHGADARDDFPRAHDRPSRIEIDTIGGLPRFFADDVRLQWAVPGDDAATLRLRALEYDVIEEQTGEGWRRTLISREGIDGHRLRHHYYLSPVGLSGNGDTLKMDLELPPGAMLEATGQAGFIPEPLPGFGAMYGEVSAVVVDQNGQRTLESGEDGVLELQLDPGAWTGIRNRFWTGLIRSVATSLTVRVESRAANLPRLVIRPAANDSRVALVLYAGPVELESLTTADSELSGMMFAALWDWLRTLTFGMLHLLTVIDGLVGNIGLAIILLSLSVKILMSPLTLIADRWQDGVNRTQAALQPHIDAIKREYKGEEAHERILAVYRDNHVHPMYPVKSLAGFLIQIPVFIAAFDMLGENFALNQAAFLWIDDLAKPDQWIALPVVLPFFGGYLNLLPCLMTGVTLLTSWLQADPVLTPGLQSKQRRRLYLMAAAFFLLFYTFPAAMVLYWTTNNVLHLAKIQLAGILRARFGRE